MLRKILAAMVILAYVGCTPSYAHPETMTHKGCTVVDKAAYSVLKQFREGTDQFNVMDSLNKKPETYWEGSNAAKLYTKVIDIDLQKNVQRGFKDRAIMDKVTSSCLKHIPVQK